MTTLPPAALTVPGWRVPTTGSTGASRDVMLTAAALRASAEATHQRLGGPGRWVLALPTDHIAGIQVVTRAELAAQAGISTPLIRLDPPAPFTVDALRAALTRALTNPVVDQGRSNGSAVETTRNADTSNINTPAPAPAPATKDALPPVYISLVPTQLHRALAFAPTAALLARCSAVLIGGAALSPALAARARAAGIPIVRTYGMTETAGGCVYDGVPLDGVRLRIDGDGRIVIAGPMLADGYSDGNTDAFTIDNDGTRWFTTSDLGHIAADGTLTVTGRADDVIITGGVNVSPQPVEHALAEILPPLLTTSHTDVCIVGIPDDEWGQAVVAVAAVAATPGGPAEAAPPITPSPAVTPHPTSTSENRLTPISAETLAQVRAAVTARLGVPSAPRAIYLADTLPLKGIGKIDRAAIRRIIEETHGHRHRMV